MPDKVDVPAFLWLPRSGGGFLTKHVWPGPIIAHDSVYEAFRARRSHRSVAPDRAKLFTLIRNPADRLYSAFQFLKNTPHPANRVNANITRRCIKKYHSFSDFMKDFEAIASLPTSIHMLPISWWLRSEHGNLDVDAIGSFEHMEESFGAIAKEYGMHVPDPWPVTVENTGAWNASSYLDKYTENQLVRVERFYAYDYHLWRDACDKKVLWIRGKDDSTV